MTDVYFNAIDIFVCSVALTSHGVHVVGPYSMFLLPVVNNPDSLFRCTRCLNKAEVYVMQFTL